MREIEKYNKIRAGLNAIKDACNFIPDMRTIDGYEKSKRVALDSGKILPKLEQARVKEKADALEYGRFVDSEASKIRTEIEGYLNPHKLAYKAIDKEKKEREENRKAELERRVQEMHGLPDAMQDSDSAGVLIAMEAMQAEECLDFYEYSMLALTARNYASECLGKMYADKLKSEAEAVELEKLRADKAKRDQETHEENIRREASAKAEQGKAEAIASEQAARLAQINAETAYHEAKKQASIDSEIAAENARLSEVARQAEAKRIEDEAQAAREADTVNIGRVRGDIKVALMTLYGLEEAAAKQITLGLCRGEIPHASVKY